MKTGGPEERLVYVPVCLLWAPEGQYLFSVAELHEKPSRIWSRTVPEPAWVIEEKRFSVWCDVMWARLCGQQEIRGLEFCFSLLMLMLFSLSLSEILEKAFIIIAYMLMGLLRLWQFYDFLPFINRKQHLKMFKYPNRKCALKCDFCTFSVEMGTCFNYAWCELLPKIL